MMSNLTVICEGLAHIRPHFDYSKVGPLKWIPISSPSYNMCLLLILISSPIENHSGFSHSDFVPTFSNRRNACFHVFRQLATPSLSHPLTLTLTPHPQDRNRKKTSLSWLINDFSLRPLLWACWVDSFDPTQRNSTCGNTNSSSRRSSLQFMSTDMNWLPHRWTCSRLYFPQEQSFSVRARE